MIRLGLVLTVCVLVGAVTHPLIGVILFPFGVVRMFR